MTRISTRTAALLLLAAAPASARAADPAQPAAQTLAQKVPSPPLTADGRLMLRRGERATIGLDRKLHVVVKAVEAVGPDGPPLRSDKPAKGDIVLYLGQDRDAGSFLRVENGGGKALRYHAVIVVPREGDLDYVPTSICPVKEHTFGLETWPNDVVGMIVGPFSKADPKDWTCME
jgi:hypothetical protein